MKKPLLALTAVALIGAACSHKAGVTGSNAAQTAVAVQQTDGGEAYVPKASAFKMSGPYADKVAVTLSDTGTLTYFPAPSDISSASAPTYLGDGWWLNNQGISANSVFTKWTFEEYSKLSVTPSQAEIMANIIPGSGLTEFRRLSIPIFDASESLSAIRSELGIK